jgi:hypothetical protein
MLIFRNFAIKRLVSMENFRLNLGADKIASKIETLKRD